MRRKESIPQVSESIDVARHVPRYLVTMGDHIVPEDKRQLRSIGGWVGGFYLGGEKFPCAWRTDFMAFVGGITPFEKRAVTAFADMEITQEMKRKRGQTVDAQGNTQILPDPVYEVLPGDDATLLLSDDYKDMGFVEITGLRGVDDNMETSLALQLQFFPEWVQWMSGETDENGQLIAAMPTLLSDRETLIRQAKIENDLHAEAQASLLESCRRFREHAQFIVNTNRELVRKGANDAGYAVNWQPTPTLYAEQLGIELEPETALRQGAAADGQLAEVLKQQADNQEKMIQLIANQQGGKIEMEKIDTAKEGQEKIEVKSEHTYTGSGEAPDTATGETDKPADSEPESDPFDGRCLAVGKVNNEPCGNKGENGYCHLDAHKKQVSEMMAEKLVSSRTQPING